MEAIFDLEYIGNKEEQFVLAGCDEVGRGPLAGPVVAATACLHVNEGAEQDSLVSLFERLKALGVTDSKKLTTKKRRKLITEFGFELDQLVPNAVFELEESNHYSLTFSIAEVSNSLIDEMNILNASLFAMKNSFENTLKEECFSSLLVDGNHIPKELPEHVKAYPVVKGDSKSVLIGVASIFAKEYRDYLMEKLNEQYPGYGLDKHAGYPTAAHKEAIAKLGVTPIHRKSFKGVREFL